MRMDHLTDERGVKQPAEEVCELLIVKADEEQSWPLLTRCFPALPHKR